MKKIFQVLISGVAAIAMLVPAGTALAYSPSLSVTSSGYDNAQITISGGAPYANIQLYYSAAGSSLYNSISNFGTTDGSGYFSTVASASSYGLNSGSRMYAVVGGDTTNTITGFGGSNCGYYGCNNGSLTFSQNNLNLTVGQSQTVTAYYNSAAIYPPMTGVYISSNSNPSAVSASTSGNSIYVYGQQNGSATLQVCVSGGSLCGSLYVTVGGSSGGPITFSQNNVTLSLKGSASVSVYPSYSGSGYYISNNSNSSAVSASLSGSTLYLYGQNTGSSTITVCMAGLSQCGSLYVNVAGGTTGNLTLSQTNLNMTPGQSSNVTVYGSTSSLYVSSNTNSSVASASISGSNLYVYANAAGSTAITVCQSYMSSCVTLYVTVSGSGSGNITFSQTNVYLTVGQSQNVTVYSNYGTGNFYISSNSNSSAVSASISGSTVYLYGQNTGSATISVCQYNSSQCGSLYATVSGSGSGSGSIWFSPSNPTLSVGQSQNVAISGNTYGSGYYISSNSDSSVVNASVSGSTLYLYGQRQGAATITVCQSGYGSNQCGSLYVTVSGSVLGGSTYVNGALIKEGSTVYIVYRNTKIAFGNWSAFTGFGFQAYNIQDVGYSGLMTSGYVIGSSYGSHPWGSWVKSGNTVYFVHESGLIPVPDYGTFLNNGGSDSRVVTANSWDFSLPQLSPMTYNDARLR